LFIEHKRWIYGERKQHKRWLCKQLKRRAYQQRGERLEHINQRWQIFDFLRAGHQLWPRRWRRNGCCARARFDFQRCGIDSLRRLYRNHGWTPLAPQE
jgi:hypothetical protein